MNTLPKNENKNESPRTFKKDLERVAKNRNARIGFATLATSLAISANFLPNDKEAAAPETKLGTTTVEALESARSEIRENPMYVEFADFTVNSEDNNPNNDTLIDAATYAAKNDPKVGLHTLTPEQVAEITVTATNLEDNDLNHITPNKYQGVVYIADFDNDGKKDLLVDRSPNQSENDDSHTI